MSHGTSVVFSITSTCTADDIGAGACTNNTVTTNASGIAEVRLQMTGNGTSLGDVVYSVPANAPLSLIYMCSLHSYMTGPIFIRD